MQTAHKIELKVNKAQKSYMDKSFGVARFTYNWALAEWNRQYKDGKSPTAFKLKREFNALKKEQFPWTYEVTKWACQQPFIHIQKAFNQFFKNKSKYPTFKKKNLANSFYIEGSCISLNDRYIKIPNLSSAIKMTESLNFSGKINSVTFSKKADRYFASFQIEVPDTIKTAVKNKSVGIDLGIKSLAITSDGHSISSLLPLKASLKKLKTQQRNLSKKKKGSANAKKQKLKIAKLHYKISCKRKDILHKTTSFLVKNYSNISIEDLNVKGMVKNHNLARSISDAGFGEFRRQLTYKSIRARSKLTLVDRFFPSSKTCSKCGLVKKLLKLSERVFTCECGLVIDRDLNAAININKIGRAPTESTPVEIAALRKAVFPYFVTSISESGIEHQADNSISLNKF